MSKEYIPSKLPYKNIDLETKSILKKTINTAGALKELKGIAKLIPNQQILISFFALQEAKTSSEIENIHTTTDQLIGIANEVENNINVKEVLRYRDAIINCFALMKKRNKKNLLIINSDIETINTYITNNNAGFRKQLGTKIENQSTGEILHIPPQKYDDILSCMSNLIEYINTDDEVDALIKMAIIHYQFEVIHPFYDGNGRTGRVLNVLYLVLKEYLEFPVLYLSSYINKNREEYYRLLQDTRITQNFEPWILYMLNGVEITSNNTIKTIKNIKRTMDRVKSILKREKVHFYSKDLLECIFSKPYTIQADLSKKLDITRQTATSYLDKLCEMKIMSVIKKRGTESKYYNTRLITLLKDSLK